MPSGATVIAVAVLVIVIGVFFLLAARRFPPGPHSAPAPPDPAVGRLVLGLQEDSQALRRAVAGVSAQTQRLEAAVAAAYAAPLPSGPIAKEGVACQQLADCKVPHPLPGTVCTGGQCVAPVSPTAVLALKGSLQTAGAKLRAALQAFSAAVDDYLGKIREWDASTPFPTFLGLQAETRDLGDKEVAKLEEAIGRAAGPLANLHAGWVDAFSNVNLDVRRDAAMGPLVQIMADALASYKRLSSSTPPSPLQSAADDVGASYRQLVNHFLLPPNLPGVPGGLGAPGR